MVQRHVFSEVVYSQSSHNVTEGWEGGGGVSKNGKKSVTYFLNGPLAISAFVFIFV